MGLSSKYSAAQQRAYLTQLVKRQVATRTRRTGLVLARLGNVLLLEGIDPRTVEAVALEDAIKWRAATLIEVEGRAARLRARISIDAARLARLRDSLGPAVGGVDAARAALLAQAL